jgi:radical SAM protein with 4Fe4S-binding SPASM domain
MRDFAPIADATAFALDRRNFDSLPDAQASSWRKGFASSRSKAVKGPRKLVIEILNSCNLDCPMCRVGQHGVDLRRSMPLSLFRDVITVVPSVEIVRLNGLGESTLLPDFPQYVDFLVKRELSVELITNGSAQMADYKRVLEAGGHVLFSWDSADPATFERLRRGATWNALLQTLREVCAECLSLGNDSRCSLIFTLQNGNAGGFTDVIRLAGELGIGSVQLNVAKQRGKLDQNELDMIQADIRQAATLAAEGGLSLYVPDQITGVRTAVPGAKVTSGTTCRAPWDEAVIRWNGDVQVCNMFNPFVYGNLQRAPFEEIWSGRFAAVFRSKLNTRDCHPYCTACAYIPDAYGHAA